MRIRLDGSEEAISIGQIEEISDLPDQQSKMFDVMIHIKQSDAYIIGDYVEIEFIIDRYDALMVPTKSIIRSGMNQYIYTYEDEMVDKLLVSTGLTKGEWVEIKDISDLVSVVVRGQNQLTADSAVMVVGETEDDGEAGTEEDLSEVN